MHTCNPSTWEDEGGGLWAWDQSGLHSDNMIFKKKKIFFLKLKFWHVNVLPFMDWGGKMFLLSSSLPVIQLSILLIFILKQTRHKIVP
jgi:hypothetical protein